MFCYICGNQYESVRGVSDGHICPECERELTRELPVVMVAKDTHSPANGAEVKKESCGACDHVDYNYIDYIDEDELREHEEREEREVAVAAVRVIGFVAAAALILAVLAACCGLFVKAEGVGRAPSPPSPASPECETVEELYEPAPTETLDDLFLAGDVIFGVATHYCRCAVCCGEDDGIFADGSPVREGVCAANWLPFGTIVEINGSRYTVCDRGGVFDTVGRIDIYCSSHTEAEIKGRIDAEINIIEMGT